MLAERYSLKDTFQTAVSLPDLGNILLVCHLQGQLCVVLAADSCSEHAV